MRDGEFATVMQQKEEDKAQKPMEKEQWAMSSMPTGKALLLIQRVLSLHHFLQSSIPQNLSVASKVKPWQRTVGFNSWGDTQFLGCRILKKMVQGKDTLNKKQSPPCWRWWHGPLFFIHRYLRSVLLLLLYHSGKLAIPHDHLFLHLQILHLVLFKSLQLQGKLSISGTGTSVRSEVPVTEVPVSVTGTSDLTEVPVN